MKTMKKIVAILAVALMLCSILPLSVFAEDTYELATSIEVGDTVVLVCESKKMELSGISTTSTKYGLGVAYSSTPAGAYVLTVEAGSTSGTYSFKCPNGQYLYWTSGNSLATNATKSANTSWTVTFSGNNAIIKNAKDTARQLQWNAGSPRFACYGNSGQTAVQLFKKVTEPEVPSACEHANAVYTHDCQPTVCPDCTETLPAKADHSYNENVTLAPTCTTAGEKTLACACGDVTTETIAALGHTYVDGACSVCGEAKPLYATIDFSTKDQRTEYTTSVQKWENDGLTLINNKGASTSNVGDYANPIRIYKSSEIIISYAGMTSLVIDANGISSNGDWKATLSAYSYTVENNVYTITFDKPTDSITLTAAAQVRANSITAYGAAPSDCEHDYVSEETQAPTCKVEGVMTYTCSKCEDSYTEAIAVIDHNYVEDIIDATCTTTGTKTYECSVCFSSYDETIPMKDHNYVDDVCADCGHVKVYKGTLVFDADKENRTKYSTEIQVWEQNGVKLTNNKASSTSNVGDYGAPGRFYKSSQVIIEFPEMSSITFDVHTGASDLVNAIGGDAIVDGNMVTVTFTEPTNSYSITLSSGKVFLNSITAIVAHECAYDNACDAECNKCGEGREVADHAYDNAFDTTCNECGAVRAVAGPLSGATKSISEDVHGYAVKFDCAAEGFGILPGTCVQTDYTNATYKGHKLIGLGVIASNGVSETNIKGLRMYELENGVAKFAFRVINIPADKLGTTITMTPYYIVEIDGVATTLYGEAVSGSYNEIAN